MNYAILKRLLDAKFPFDTSDGTGHGKFFVGDMMLFGKWNMDQGCLPVPTLSDLIKGLNVTDFSLVLKDGVWTANGVSGETPKLAVSNLYLKLYE